MQFTLGNIILTAVTVGMFLWTIYMLLKIPKDRASVEYKTLALKMLHAKSEGYAGIPEDFETILFLAKKLGPMKSPNLKTLAQEARDGFVRYVEGQIDMHGKSKDLGILKSLADLERDKNNFLKNVIDPILRET